MAVRAFFAPGRVNLIGEHTDYSGGLVLPAAIERGITLSVTGGGDRIRLTTDRDIDRGAGGIDVGADGSEPPATGWGRYVSAVAAELTLLGHHPTGMVGAVTSDLPTGSGLSSSAALQIVTAMAMCALGERALAPIELAQLARRAEQRAVGVPCGLMDQAASVLCAADSALLLDCASLEHRTVPLPVDLAIVIVDSGVARRLEESDYARRRSELEEGIAALGGRTPREVDASRVEETMDAVGLTGVARHRLRHVVTENARVAEVAALLATRPVDRGALGDVLARGHASLRDDFEVSTPELDVLVELAVEAGAVAARMTGGGFGGAIVALVDRGVAPTVAARIVRRYRDRTGRTGHALVTAAAAGAREIG